MKRRTILIIPPRGVPLKAFRIRLSVAVFFVVVVLIGVTGLFLPLETLTDDAVEQNQKRNLTEQNKALLQKVLATLRMLKNLKAQVSRLEDKKEQVLKVSGNNPAKPEEPLPEIDFSRLNSEEILEYVTRIENRFSAFGSSDTAGDTAAFDSLPVLRPIPEPYLISRRFGLSIDPFSGKKKQHNGTDFVAEEGTPVLATGSGFVKRVETNAIWGRRVVIEHGRGFTTVYAHLGTVKVKNRSRVTRGDVIGEIGTSGLSSGPHVHYEIWHYNEPVNPEEYLFPEKLYAEN